MTSTEWRKEAARLLDVACEVAYRAGRKDVRDRTSQSLLDDQRQAENALLAHLDAAPQPIEPATPPEVAAIIERLHTQDNRITSHPLFAVQQKSRIYGLNSDYCNAAEWVLDGETITVEPGEEVPAGARRVGYIDKWEFVTGCLTEQGCKDFIACNGHNLHEPRIYAYSGYRNAEFIALREWLMSRSDAAPQAAQPAIDAPSLDEREALAELVACYGLRMEIGMWNPESRSLELQGYRDDLRKREPAAIEQARALLAQKPQGHQAQASGVCGAKTALPSATAGVAPAPKPDRCPSCGIGYGYHLAACAAIAGVKGPKHG